MCCSSQKTSDRKQERKERAFEALKRNSLSSALPLRLDGPCFPRLLAGSARVCPRLRLGGRPSLL